MEYNHSSIETKWQKIWQEINLYRTRENPNAEKFYILDMFPYPSGEGLHVGHPKGYIATDVIARKKMMEGKNVLHPMGSDAFGLPAENYALKHKVHPAVAVKENIKRFKEQLLKIGFTYDWEREVSTIDPSYYKWTQWIFLQMFHKGLAYESHEPINWCPSCKTGLANEDVEDGRCERCGTIVEKKPLRQWVLRITDYAERLLSDLDILDWPEAIKDSQRHWIGKSEGAEIDFLVKGAEEKITVFTTRPDTLYGVTYVVVAPEHQIVQSLLHNVNNRETVERFIEAIRNKPDIERTAEGKEKNGVPLEGVSVIHPLTKQEIPLWIADYVLADYGTGAVMAVPAHDDRDYDFAKKYNLPRIDVVIPGVVDKKNPPRDDKKTVARNNVHALVQDPKTKKFLLLQWKDFPWRNFVVGGVEDGEDIIEAARREVREETGYTDLKFIKILGGPVQGQYFAAHKDENRIAYTTAVYFELTNSIPEQVSEAEKNKYDIEWVSLDHMNEANMVCAELDIWKRRLLQDSAYCDEGLMYNSEDFSGQVSKEAQQDITNKANGRWVTKYKLRDWIFSRQRYWGEPIPLIHCEKCGVVAVPEKDLPVILPEVESYEPTGTGESPLATITDWVNVDCPQCGGRGKRETNTMPQWAGSSWYYLRYIDPKNEDQLVGPEKEKYWSPVDLYVGGAEHATRHLIYARFWYKFLYDIKVVSYPEPFKRYSNLGLIMGEDGRKMSKRWGNIINPDEMIAKFGADAFRVYEMFVGPFTQSASFKESGVSGAHNFLRRVWQLQDNITDETEEASIVNLLHKTIKKVSEDIDNLRFNTAVSSLMILVNALADSKSFSNKTYDTLVQLLAPFAPHVTEELWHRKNRQDDDSIYTSTWPSYDENLLQDEVSTIAVQVNGKLRDTFEISSDASEEEIKSTAMAQEKIQQWMQGKEVVKVIVVKGKLVSIVVT
jgi:leucyl-tRNA synthetase